MFGLNTYTDDVKAFKQIFSSEADNLLTNENLAIVYIGRGSCPFCRKFAKNLSTLSKDIKETIYYVNSEDFSDDNIPELRQKYGVRTVPGFLVKNNNKIEVRCDSSMSDTEILKLIE